MPTILIVDDEQHIRLLIEQTLEDLEDEGVELQTAADGEMALDVVRNHKPELVFLEARPGSDLPRDIEHLRRQELVMAFARAGGWEARPEFGIDPAASRSRSIDVLLSRLRGAELAVVEVVDLLADGGATLRGLADKVASVRRSSAADTRVAGLLVLRATARNRGTMRQLEELFANRFRAPSTDWLRALERPSRPMPTEDGILWSSVDGSRLMSVRRQRAD